MPFVFLIVGVVMLVSGVRDTSADLLTLLKGDLINTHGFAYWMIAILVVGGVGYIQGFTSLSRSFLVLLLIVLVLAQSKNGAGGFFTEAQSQLKQITGGAA